MLTLDTIRSRAPAVFTREGSPSTSNLFAAVSTADILERMFGAGFIASRAQQVGTTNYGYHMVTLRHPDHRPMADGTVPEIILTNAADGSRSFRLRLGLFRFVCANGLVAGNQFGDWYVDHRSDAPERALDLAHMAGYELEKLAAWCEQAQSLPVGEEWRRAYARRAAAIRWAGPLGTVDPVGVEDSEALLVTRRLEDIPLNVWNTYNVVQENMVRGGTVHTIGTTGRRTLAKPISSLQRDLEINTKLFDLTTHMMKEAA